MQQPYQQFGEWLEQAKTTPTITEPMAMCLATVGAGGIPSSRMVLLKGYDEKGFVFYTNYESRKGQEILSNPYAALCFYWMPLKRQIRVEGILSPVSDTEADAYFRSRPRQSQIGAWASKQSRPLDGMATLIKDVALLNAKYVGREVPRPPYWSGFRLDPSRIEFWQEGDFRLHEREVYERDEQGWVTSRLYP